MALVRFTSAKRLRRGSKQTPGSLDVQLARYLDHALPRDAFYLQMPDAAAKDVENTVRKCPVPDARPSALVIFWKRRAFCLEVKSGSDRLSGQQRNVHARLHDAGIPVEVVRSLPEAVVRLKEYGIPLKAEIRL
jgi:hypothetical protein